MNSKGVGGRGVASLGIAHVHGVACCQALRAQDKCQ